jgi:hypothetical protein
MKKITVLVTWSGDNYCAGLGGEESGVVIAAHQTLEGVKKEFASALAFHIKGCLKDGDELPEYLKNGNYELDFKLATSALLQSLSGVLTHAAISKATGINQRQIGHYANGRSNPRLLQRDKIVLGIRKIGKELMVVE